MQKLILPNPKIMMLCGYKNTEYTNHWGYPHYGIDMSTIQGNSNPKDHNIYASGNCTIIDCGFDNSGGNVVIALYEDVYNHHTGEKTSLIARYMHLNAISVSKGQKLIKGALIGVEGNTKTGDYHLHIEFDTDTKYPYHSPQVSSRDDKLSQSQGNILKKGTDSSINPSYIFHIGENQELVKPTYNPAWLNKEDFVIPKLEEIDYKSLYEADHAKLEKIKEIINQK